MPLLSLPNEILLNISIYLDFPSSFCLLRASRHFHALLIQRVADFRNDEYYGYGYEKIALYLAAAYKDETLIRHLLHLNPEALSTDEFGSQASADLSNLNSAVSLLLHHREKILVGFPEDRESVLHWAATEPFEENLLQLLLLQDIDVNVGDVNGVTPLHLTAALDREMSTRLLLEKGANVNAIDYRSETPLHYNPSENIARVLLEYGADRRVVNLDGLTAWEKAKWSAPKRLRGEILELLDPYGGADE